MDCRARRTLADFAGRRAAFNTDVYLDWISGREGLYLKVAAHLHVLALVVAMVAGLIDIRQFVRSR